MADDDFLHCRNPSLYLAKGVNLVKANLIFKSSNLHPQGCDFLARFMVLLGFGSV